MAAPKKTEADVEETATPAALSPNSTLATRRAAREKREKASNKRVDATTAETK